MQRESLVLHSKDRKLDISISANFSHHFTAYQNLSACQGDYKFLGKIFLEVERGF